MEDTEERTKKISRGSSQRAPPAASEGVNLTLGGHGWPERESGSFIGSNTKGQSFPYLDKAFIAAAKEGRWKNLAEQGEEDVDEPEELEILSAIFPDLERIVLLYILAEEAHISKEEDPEILLEVCTTRCERLASLESGETGEEGRQLYQRLVHGIKAYRDLLGMAIKGTSGELGEEEEVDDNDDDNDDDTVADEGPKLMKNDANPVIEDPSTMIGNHELWGAYRVDPSLQCPPATKADSTSVKAGQNISLYYTDGNSGWWDGTVISNNKEAGSAQVRFHVGGRKEIIYWDEWLWRLYLQKDEETDSGDEDILNAYDE